MRAIPASFTRFRAYDRDARWDALLLAVAGAMVIAVGRAHELSGAVAAAHPALVFLALAIGLYLIGQDGPRRASQLRGRTTTALLCFAVWAALSVPGALNQGVAFWLLVHPFASSVLLYLLVAGSVRGVRDVERLALIYAIAATVYGVVIVQRFGLAANWHMENPPYYDANGYATLLVTALPLAGYCAARRGSPGRRVLGGVLCLILLVELARTGSRGGLLALLAALLCAAWVYRSVSTRTKVAAAVVVALALGVVGGARYWHRVERIAPGSEDYNYTAEGGRLAVWRRGIGYVMQRPVLGLGAANFPVAEGTISPLAWRQEYGIGVKWSVAHNTYLQVAAELGIPGLIIYLVMLGGAFRALALTRRTGTDAAPLAEALIAALAGFCVGSFFLSLAYREFPYVLLGLSVGLRKAILPPQEAGSVERLVAPLAHRARPPSWTSAQAHR